MMTATIELLVILMLAVVLVAVLVWYIIHKRRHGK